MFKNQYFRTVISEKPCQIHRHNQTSNFEWIDNLKVIALFAVIVLHTASPLLMDFKKADTSDWLVGDFYNALVRFAVPVFVMITGALLLHREYEIGRFSQKAFDTDHLAVPVLEL